MKRFLLILMCIIACATMQSQTVYSPGFANLLTANYGYVQASQDVDSIVTIKLIGDWESLRDIDDNADFWPKHYVDLQLMNMKGYVNVEGWHYNYGGLFRSIRVERNLLEFYIPTSHDILYIFETPNTFKASKNVVKKKSAKKSTTKKRKR